MSTNWAELGDGGRVLRRIRALLMGVLLLGVVGTGVELLLLEHTDGFWQWNPLLLILISFLVLGWHAADRRAASTQALRATMLVFVLSGATGILLHYRGNVEFELEMYPSLTGWELFRQAMKGATPSLAPGVMIQLGLLGFAYTYRHPALKRGTGVDSDKKGA